MFIILVLQLLIEWTLRFIVVLTLAGFATILAFKLKYEPRSGVCKCKAKMNGKTVLITGGNSGIGLETARDLVQRGARVIIASCNQEKSEKAIKNILSTTGNSGHIHYCKLDLSSLEDVRRFAEEFRRKERRLDVLICNAGAGGLGMKLTRNGIDKVMQINYVGHFLLTNLLLDMLAASAPARVVIVSSLAHKIANFDPSDLRGERTDGYWNRYKNSKLCCVLWARALSTRLPRGVTVNVLHPGIISTDIYRRMPTVTKNILMAVIKWFFKNCVEGAQTTIHLSVAPEIGDCSGGYYADCRLSEPSHLAYDQQLVDKVWRDTIALTENFMSTQSNSFLNNNKTK